MSNRTPRGGRMGIPKCGGMHGVQSEHFCFDCQPLQNQEETNRLLRIRVELLQEQLELEFKGYRTRRVHKATETPVSAPEKPIQERRGL